MNKKGLAKAEDSCIDTGIKINASYSNIIIQLADFDYWVPVVPEFLFLMSYFISQHLGGHLIFLHEKCPFSFPSFSMRRKTEKKLLRKRRATSVYCNRRFSSGSGFCSFLNFSSTFSQKETEFMH
jgi:hypothetical protein